MTSDELAREADTDMKRAAVLSRALDMIFAPLQKAASEAGLRDREREAAIDAATATTRDGFITASVRLTWGVEELPADPNEWVRQTLRDALNLYADNPSMEVDQVEVEAA